MSESHQIAVRQADFLNQLSGLMNKFQAEFHVDDRREDDGGPVIGIDACGSWIPFHQFGTHFDVDACIAATQSTIEHAKALAPTPMKNFTTGEIAKICKVAPRQVSKWFDSGKLKGFRIPGSQDRRIPYDYLLRFLNENGMDDVAREANLLPIEFAQAVQR